MTKPRAGLTELEGAILGVLREAGAMTAYAVRQVFLRSRSAEWSGSAGAVYPALKRLRRAGLTTERAKKDGRGTKVCTLTAKGKAAHDEWLCDVARAISPGMDPFRTRAGFWAELPAERRRALMRQLQSEIQSMLAETKREQVTRVASDATQDDLVIALLEARLRWLDSQS